MTNTPKKSSGGMNFFLNTVLYDDDTHISDKKSNKKESGRKIKFE